MCSMKAFEWRKEAMKDFSMTYEVHVFEDVHSGGGGTPPFNMTSASSFSLDTSLSHLAKPTTFPNPSDDLIS